MLRELFLLSALVALALGAATPSVQLDDEWAGRIVGGSNAGGNQFPHQCSLRTSGNAHFCGGSIVNNRWIVSAAHCTIGRTLANTRVIVGTNSRTAGGVGHNSARIVNHPNYNANTIANDISVVQTATVMGFNAAVQPIGLGANTIGGGVNAVVSGWGQTTHPGSAPVQLQFLNVQTHTNAVCAQRHGGNGNMIFATSLCAGGLNNQGTCMGDSGGPLIAGGNVIGAVSWGIACGRGFPDVYARISSFRPWIIGII